MRKFFLGVMFLGGLGATTAFADCEYRWNPATGQYVMVCSQGSDDDNDTPVCEYAWDPATGEFVWVCG